MAFSLLVTSLWDALRKDEEEETRKARAIRKEKKKKVSVSS